MEIMKKKGKNVGKKGIYPYCSLNFTPSSPHLSVDVKQGWAAKLEH